jgi:hypothetical protein
MDVKAFIADNLNGFSFADIPLFLFQLFVAAFWAFLLRMIYVRKFKEEGDSEFANWLVILAVTVAAVTAMVKASVPLAIGFVAAVLLVRWRSEAKKVSEAMSLFLTIGIGIGCGAGHTILTSLGFAVVMVLLLLMPVKQ